MAFCSFGGPGEDNLCSPIEWAKQEISMVPLLSGIGSGASGSRGRPADKGSGSGGKKCKIICYLSKFNPSYIHIYSYNECCSTFYVYARGSYIASYFIYVRKAS